MRVAIMQPYWFAYIGYYQLIAAVDQFVIYDNIQYTKKGWINRNRILRNGEPASITIPIRKASDYLDVNERQVADSLDSKRMLRTFRDAYLKAPHREEALGILQTSLDCPDLNLSSFINRSVEVVCNHLGIETRRIVSSSLGVDRKLRGQERVIATCSELRATVYTNPIGGVDLYSAQEFHASNIDLVFLKSTLSPYRQMSRTFIPAMSILDVIANVGLDETRSRVLTDFSILNAKDAVELAKSV